MAQFRGTLVGNRGEVSRLGHKGTGITARLNGWEFGVETIIHHIDGKDSVDIYLTSGSGGAKSSKYIGRFFEADLNDKMFVEINR